VAPTRVQHFVQILLAQMRFSITHDIRRCAMMLLWKVHPLVGPQVTVLVARTHPVKSSPRPQTALNYAAAKRVSCSVQGRCMHAIWSIDGFIVAGRKFCYTAHGTLYYIHPRIPLASMLCSVCCVGDRLVDKSLLCLACQGVFECN